MKTINTERLILLPLSMEYCSEEYLNWLNDPEVYKFLETRGNQNMEMLKDFIENQIKNKVAIWAITLKSSGKHIGNIKIDPINFKHGFGEYGILMGEKNEWGKGYAKEASIGVIDYFFNEINLRKITLGVVRQNTQAVALYEKLGFVTEGIYKEHLVYDGIYYDVLRMSLFNKNR
ncbi:GNAT family N-acetyltransferase [Flavobacterium sp.]|jgi:ribosomal-protein-alanine N-acetyltransferase|uniref:GNAT family N-acetyltransferase n=1 Tax=Flavobacterium sp. TaxID=239 RepID=UPI0037C14903